MFLFIRLHEQFNKEQKINKQKNIIMLFIALLKRIIPLGE